MAQANPQTLKTLFYKYGFNPKLLGEFTSQGADAEGLLSYAEQGGDPNFYLSYLDMQRQSQAQQQPNQPQTSTQDIRYSIAKGDTLSDIANRYGISMDKLAELNGIKNRDKIIAGQEMKLPAGAALTAKYNEASVQAEREARMNDWASKQAAIAQASQAAQAPAQPTQDNAAMAQELAAQQDHAGNRNYNAYQEMMRNAGL